MLEMGKRCEGIDRCVRKALGEYAMQSCAKLLAADASGWPLRFSPEELQPPRPRPAEALHL